MGFYSILVRLKVISLKRLSISETFLFHTGSIKSCHRPCSFERVPLFLFHTGSIKSKSDLSEACDFSGFYSILVRLKVRRSIPTRKTFLSFLFHTGSIKRSNGACVFVALDAFLFHTGSIKRWRTRKAELIEKVSIPYWFD